MKLVDFCSVKLWIPSPTTEFHLSSNVTKRPNQETHNWVKLWATPSRYFFSLSVVTFFLDKNIYINIINENIKSREWISFLKT